MLNGKRLGPAIGSPRKARSIHALPVSVREPEVPRERGDLRSDKTVGPDVALALDRFGTSPCRGILPHGHHNESTRRGQCDFTGYRCRNGNGDPRCFRGPAGEAVATWIVRFGTRRNLAACSCMGCATASALVSFSRRLCAVAGSGVRPGVGVCGR
jgi:hypothetical protein